MVILPSEYQEVKYLESTGTQYIDSGISLNDKDFVISCDFEQTQYFSSTEQSLFSIWTSQYNYWNCFIIAKSIRVYTAAHHVISDAITTGERRKVTVERNSSSWKLNYKNQSVQWSYTPTYINPTTLKIFTRGDTPPQSSSNTHIKMYALIIEIEGNKEANFIPCYRKSDHKPGMYDLVSKTFFTNAGIGEFIVGADVIRYNAPALVLRRRLLLSNPHIEAASGSIATFSTDLVGKLKECKIYFEPVQEGDGDPSPDNVRPITGWTGCEVTISQTTQSLDGTIIPIDWTDEAGTVYGGYVDLVKGEVVAERFTYEFTGTERVAVYTSTYVIWPFNRPVGLSISGDDIISSHFSRSEMHFSNSSKTTVQINKRALELSGVTSDTELKAFFAEQLQAGTPVQYSYALETPIHYPIGPITLKTLRGTNNIFANTNGNAEVKFYTH